MALLERLFAEQYTSLLAFFGRRIKSSSDAADLVQEVYARMLRVNEPDAIRNPQAYLFAVAGNLAREQALLDGRRARSVEFTDPLVEAQLYELPTFERDFDRQQRVARLRVVLAQLPAKCQATVVLHYREGLSHQQLAERLGISTHMVKKYLSQALLHCRRRMQRMA